MATTLINVRGGTADEQQQHRVASPGDKVVVVGDLLLETYMDPYIPQASPNPPRVAEQTLAITDGEIQLTIFNETNGEQYTVFRTVTATAVGYTAPDGGTAIIKRFQFSEDVTTPDAESVLRFEVNHTFSFVPQGEGSTKGGFPRLSAGIVALDPPE